MIGTLKSLRYLLLFTGMWFGFALAAFAGGIDLVWDPVSSPNLIGYRIYYDVAPGGQYSKTVDVGNVTTTTLAGLADCTYHYVAVKAVKAGGQVSADFSNVIEGYPHPEIASIVPNVIAPGESADVVVSGDNFSRGAVPEFSGGMVTVTSYTADSCGQMTLRVAVSASAPPTGSADLLVTNTDRSFGSLTGALRFTAGSTTALKVASVSPAPGALDVDPKTPLVVTFSKAIDPATVTPSRFQIRRAGAQGFVRPASGFPRLDDSGMRVTLEADGALLAGQAYTVFVKGGPKGVKDTDHVAISSNYLQPTAFTTTDIVDNVLSGPPDDPDGSDLESLEPGCEVEPSSVFVARFKEPLDASSIGPMTFRIIRSGQKRVALETGAIPTLSQDGRSVVLEPAEPLPCGKRFELIVRGGPKGVESERGVKLAKKWIRIRFTTPISAVASLGVAE